MDAHENLLSEWNALGHHIHEKFVRDGIIDPVRWEAVPCKVLLLLKEAYGEPGTTEGYDLRALIRDRWQGPKSRMWWNAAYWCLGANALGGFPEMQSDPAAKSAAREALLSSAIVNVKKSNGRSHSRHEDIEAYGLRDGLYLKRQVDLINPRIVICGNTWRAIKHLWPAATQVFDLVWKSDDRLIVNFWHPANQFPKHLNYYALGFLVDRARQYEKSGPRKADLPSQFD